MYVNNNVMLRSILLCTGVVLVWLLFIEVASVRSVPKFKDVDSSVVASLIVGLWVLVVCKFTGGEYCRNRDNIRPEFLGFREHPLSWDAGVISIITRGVFVGACIND